MSDTYNYGKNSDCIVKDSLENFQNTIAAESKAITCNTCIFYYPATLNNGYSLGKCRRHAPTISGSPSVFKKDWCGDYKLDESKKI